MSAVVNAFCQQRDAAKRAGIAIVRNLLQTNQFPDGVTTKQLYKLAVQQPAPPNFKPFPLPPSILRPKKLPKKRRAIPEEAKDVYPPHPDHPIRSLKFLKTEILGVLKSQREISTFRQAKASAAKLAEEGTLSAPSTKKEKKALSGSHMEFVWKVLPPKQPPPPPPVKEVIGREVGVGADISHLNKRRQAARVAKVGLSVMKMKAIRQGVKPRPLDGRPNYRANMLNAGKDSAT